MSPPLGSHLEHISSFPWPLLDITHHLMAQLSPPSLDWELLWGPIALGVVRGWGRGSTHPHSGSARARTGCLIHSGTCPRSEGRQVHGWVKGPGPAWVSPLVPTASPQPGASGGWRLVPGLCPKAGPRTSAYTHTPPCHHSPPAASSLTSFTQPPSPASPLGRTLASGFQ